MATSTRTGIGLLFRPRFLLAAGLLSCVVWLASFIVHEVNTEGLVDNRGVAVGRDFLGFYAAGRIVQQGDGASLYDPQLQRQVQAQILAPQRLDGYIYFINPAFVAVSYAPLARLPYRLAFYLHTALMLLCCVAGILLLKKRLGGLRARWLASALLSCAWFPMIHTVLGGQNAALSFLLLSWAWVCASSDRQAWTGLALGLQLYKPQHALPFLGLLLLKGRLVTVAVAGVVAGVEYLMGGLSAGWRWPLTMSRTLSGFYREHERRASGHTHIALPEVLDYSVAQPLERAGLGGAVHVVRSIGLGLAATLLIHLVWTWRRADPYKSSFALYWALATAVSLLASLHTQHYEVAVLLLPVLILIDHRLGSDRPLGILSLLLLLAAYLLLPLVLLADVGRLIQFQPWVLMPVGVAWWAHREIFAHAE